MRHFKNTQGELFGIDIGQEFLIQSDWIELSVQNMIEIFEPTEEELKNQCSTEAKRRLMATDYTQFADVMLENKSDFDSYRFAIRSLFLSPVPNPLWPIEPTPVWPLSE